MEKRWHTLPRGCGYQIVRRLGGGGDGTVYLVCHLCTEQLRAAKILRNVRPNRLHELDMMKHLDHPSLPRIMDVLTQEDDVWLIMEYIHGRRLDTLIGEGLPRQKICEVAGQLSEVLRYLHTAEPPIFHLDVKPSNLLIRPDGRLTLIDFGASIRATSSTEENAGYGTPGFAAPEQFKKGAQVDARTDIYGFGATIYYCRYGRAPGSSAGPFGTETAEYKGPLQKVVRRCLQEDPQRRFRDGENLCQALARARKKAFLCRWFGLPALFLAAALIMVLLFHRSTVEEQQSAQKRQQEDMRILNETETEAMAAEQSGTEEAGATEKWAETEIEIETQTEEQNGIENIGMARQQYLRLLEMAKGAGFSEALECYAQAAELFPADEEWYLQLIQRVTGDALFDREEEAALRELIYADVLGEGISALELLQEDRESYGLVAYRMGLAYWYYYEGTGAKSAAAWWFDQALQNRGKAKEETWVTTARILAKIGNYYGMLERTGEDEEREEKEWEYWGDLKELWRLFSRQKEETDILVETASEVLSLEILKAYEFRVRGEKQEEMLAVLSEIEAFSQSDAFKGQEKKRQELTEQIFDARAAVERAFQDMTGVDGS